jgi:hypothetical protein
MLGRWQMVKALPPQEKDKLVYYDWDGWETGLGKLPPLDSAKKEAPVHFAWAKNRFRMHTTTRTIDIDTEASKITESADKVPVILTNGELTLSFPFADSDSRLCVLSRTEDKTRNRIEIQRPAFKQRKVILAEGDYNIDQLQAFPSPDDKLVALRCKDGERKERILVIDPKGEILANIAVDE